MDVFPAWLIMATTGATLALVASILVVRIAPAASGAGVALVMANLNGIHVPKLLAVETILVKVLGTACSVASGLPVGPEGPLVHIGAGVASFCTRQQRVRFQGKTVFSTHGHRWLDTFHNDGDRRDFLSAGVASGLAAAFGAPIGGVLFSLEEASTFWSHDTTWRSLLCSTLAIFTLSLLHTVTSREVSNREEAETLLSIASPGLISFGDGGVNGGYYSHNGGGGSGDTTTTTKTFFYVWELPIFIALAAAAGVIGAGLTHASARLAPRRSKVPAIRVLEAAAAAALCVTVAIIASQIFGSCRPVPGFNEQQQQHDRRMMKNETDGKGSHRGGEDERWGASVAVRLTCPKGEFNDLAALLLGLRDDIIANVLSVGQSSPSSSSSSQEEGTSSSSSSSSPSSSSEKSSHAADVFPFSAVSVSVALVVTLATMVIACDLGLPAGMFMPTILWGALLGSLFGFAARTLATHIFDDPRVAAAVAPGTYALVGATAALAGVFRSSISLVVIMLEGTGHIGYLVPLLVGVAVANLTGNFINGDSFYEEQLRAKGVPFLHHHDVNAPCTAEPHASTVVASCMSEKVVCLFPNESVARIEWVLRNTRHNGFPVVTPPTKNNNNTNNNMGTRTVIKEEDEGLRGTSSTFTTTAAAHDDESDRGGGGRLVGIVLRSQLMVLLARRAFVEIIAPPLTAPVYRFPPFGFEPLVNDDTLRRRQKKMTTRHHEAELTEKGTILLAGDSEDSPPAHQGIFITGDGGGGGGGGGGRLSGPFTEADIRLKRTHRAVTGFIRGVASRTSTWFADQSARKKNAKIQLAVENSVAKPLLVSRNSSLHSLHSLHPDDTDDDCEADVREEQEDPGEMEEGKVEELGALDATAAAAAAAANSRGLFLFTDSGDDSHNGEHRRVLEEEQRTLLEAYYDAIDTDMRTFHHRHSFHDRGVSVSEEAVARLGLTHAERDMHCDLVSFMTIAPLSVQSTCSAWRALGYFRSLGLRHLPVVDESNVVVGMLTRGDLIPHIRRARAPQKNAASEAVQDDAAEEEEEDEGEIGGGGFVDDESCRGEDAGELSFSTWLVRTLTPLVPASRSSRRALAGDDLFQTVQL